MLTMPDILKCLPLLIFAATKAEAETLLESVSMSGGSPVKSVGSVNSPYLTPVKSKTFQTLNSPVHTPSAHRIKSALNLLKEGESPVKYGAPPKSPFRAREEPTACASDARPVVSLFGEAPLNDSTLNKAPESDAKSLDSPLVAAQTEDKQSAASKLIEREARSNESSLTGKVQEGGNKSIDSPLGEAQPIDEPGSLLVKGVAKSKDSTGLPGEAQGSDTKSVDPPLREPQPVDEQSSDTSVKIGEAQSNDATLTGKAKESDAGSSNVPLTEAQPAASHAADSLVNVEEQPPDSGHNGNAQLLSPAVLWLINNFPKERISTAADPGETTAPQYTSSQDTTSTPQTSAQNMSTEPVALSSVSVEPSTSSVDNPMSPNVSRQLQNSRYLDIQSCNWVFLDGQGNDYQISHFNVLNFSLKELR